jgi:hypothetical protein
MTRISLSGSSRRSIRSTAPRMRGWAAGSSPGGETAAALLEFQATVALGPANPAEAHSDVAEALLKLGRREEARRSALLALKVAADLRESTDILIAASGN